MASPNGLQQLQQYNSSDSNISTPSDDSPTDTSRNYDQRYVQNIIDWSRDDPNYGTTMIGEEYRAIYDRLVREQPNNLTFDEMNEQLLSNQVDDPLDQDLHRSSPLNRSLSEFAEPDSSQDSISSVESIHNTSTDSDLNVEPPNAENDVEPPIDEIDVDGGVQPNVAEGDDQTHANQNEEEVEIPESPVSPTGSGSDNQEQESAQPGSPVSQTGSGISISSRLRSAAFKKHLADYEFLPDHETNNLPEFLEKTDPLIRNRLLEAIKEHRGIKFWIIVVIEYEHMVTREAQEPSYLHSVAHTLYNENDIDLDAVFEELKNGNCNLIRNKSGLQIRKIVRLDLQIAEFKPLAGSSYLPLPTFLANKKAIINVQNTDNRCFGYAILASK